MQIMRQNIRLILLSIVLLSILNLPYAANAKFLLGERVNVESDVPEVVAKTVTDQRSDNYPLEITPANPERIELEYAFLEPKMGEMPDGYYSASIERTHKFSEEPGLPLLPIKIAKILIPQGRDVKNIETVPGRKITLEGQFKIEYAKQQVPIEPPNSKVKTKLNPIVETEPNMEVYGSSNPFPGKLYSEVSTQYFTGYKILTLNLYPIQYIPVSGEVSYYPDMRVVVTTVPAEPPYVPRARCRNLPKDISRVKKLIDNPSLLDTYSAETAGIGETGTIMETTEATPLLDTYSAEAAGIGETGTIMEVTPLSLTGGPYEYVIITNEAMESAVETLAAHKSNRGLTTNIVTVEWIYANYDGTCPDGGTDQQTKIRNFIIDAYNDWQTQYVVLGGDGDGAGTAVIPHRGVYGKVGTGGSATVDQDIPCDLYYGALDGTWDKDADGIYGEGSGAGGGTAGEEADLLAEVYVGRIAADTPEEAANQINKIIAYENSLHSRSALLVGGQLDANTYGGDYKDEVYTDFFPGDWLATKLYNKTGTFSKSAVIEAMNCSKHHVVNNMGHSNNTYDMGLTNADVDGITNTAYFLAYSQGCYSNAFDNRTDTVGSYTVDAISEHFTAENDRAAFAYIGNTRYGWYVQGSTNGASQQFDKQFFDAIFNEDKTNVGIALQDSKEDLIGSVGSTGAMRWCYFALCLLGDPETPIAWSGDTTPPSGTPSTPADEGAYSYDFTITFNWTQGTATDPESGIAGYYLQVGTTPGGNDKFDGDVGNVLTKDIGGCETGETYYARVRARNGAGLYGGAYSGNSDGITSAYPDLTLSSTDITFSNPAPEPDDVITISATIHNDGGSYLDISPINIGSQANGAEPATAGSYQGSYYPENINDGDYSTAWASSYNSDWVKIDLAAIKSIKKIYWDDTYFVDANQPGTFSIWFSTDDVSYTSIDSVTGYTGSSYTLILDTAVSARYVKMEVTARAPGSAATLDELEVYEGYDTVVRFFDGDPGAGGTQIGANRHLPPIPASGTKSASVQWTAIAGSHDIYVVVDPADLILESNETNNKAYKSLSVGAAEFISFTVEDLNNDGVQFSTVDPGMENQPADQTDDLGAVTLTIGSETNVDVDIQVRGTDFTGPGVTIPIGNVKYDDVNNPGGASMLTESYVIWYTVTAGTNNERQVWYWITIPPGQPAGDYTSTFYYQAVKSP